MPPGLKRWRCDPQQASCTGEWHLGCLGGKGPGLVEGNRTHPPKMALIWGGELFYILQFGYIGGHGHGGYMEGKLGIILDLHGPTFVLCVTGDFEFLKQVKYHVR